MYYWEPSDLKALENEDAVKSHWINSEIKSAAAEIFRNWVPMLRGIQSSLIELSLL